MNRKKIKQYYEDMANSYDSVRFECAKEKFVDEIQRGLILDMLGNLNGKKVLDIGCGTGRIGAHVAAHNPKADVIGVDTSKSMLKIAKNKAKKMKLKNIVFKEGDIYNLKLPRGYFDVITFIRVIWHLEHPEIALNHIKKLLKKDGILIVDFLNKQSYLGMLNRIRKDKQEVVSEFYSVKDILELLRKSGFSIESFKGQELLPYKVWNKKFLRWVELHAISRLFVFTKWIMIKARKV